MAPRPQQSSPPPDPSNQTRLEPERLGDVEQGAEAPESDVDELGLTASEREAWDAMESDSRAAPESNDPEVPEPPADGEPGEAPDPAAPKPPVAAAEDDDDDGPAQPQRGKGNTVSRHKYSRELTKREQQIADLQNKLNSTQIDYAKLNERLTILNEALTAPPPVDPAQAQQQAMAENPWLEPDVKVEDDAIAAIAQMKRRQDYNNRIQNQTTEAFQETQEEAELKTAFNRDIQRFSSTEEGKNFGDAYGYIKNSRLTEIAISLFDKDPNDPNEHFTQRELDRIIQDFNSEEKWVVSNALQGNKSPAQAIVKLARSRGWKPPEAQPAPARQNGAPPARGAPPAPRAAPAGGTAVEKLNAEIAGAAAARSLSDGGGAPPLEPLDAVRLLKMSDEEFGQYIDSVPKHRLDSLLGKEPEPAQQY